MCYKRARIHYILVEYGLLGVNRSFGKSLQMSGTLFSGCCDFESKINVYVILQWRAIAIALNSGPWGGWKVETEGGKMELLL